MSERKGKVIPGRGAKTEKAWEPTAESVVQETWRLRVSEDEWRVLWEGV